MSGKLAILREHDVKSFQFTLNGRDVYELTQRLMRDAIAETCYDEVAKCVSLRELIAGQARQQGFNLVSGPRNDSERAAGIYPTRQ